MFILLRTADKFALGTISVKSTMYMNQICKTNSAIGTYSVKSMQFFMLTPYNNKKTLITELRFSIPYFPKHFRIIKVHCY